MDDVTLVARLEALEKKIDATFVAADKTRKYILTITIISVIAFVLPALGLVFAVPALLSTYAQIGNL